MIKACNLFCILVIRGFESLSTIVNAIAMPEHIYRIVRFATSGEGGHDSAMDTDYPSRRILSIQLVPNK